MLKSISSSRLSDVPSSVALIPVPSVFWFAKVIENAPATSLVKVFVTDVTLLYDCVSVRVCSTCSVYVCGPLRAPRNSDVGYSPSPRHVRVDGIPSLERTTCGFPKAS